MAWIAVDAGTSVIKTVAYTETGTVLALARETMEVLSSRPGFLEQDMNSVWNAVASAVREVSQNIHEPVQGIAITAQGDGCWLIDADGWPTGNAILWNDGRAKSFIDVWHNSNIINQAFRISGSVTYPGLANAILRWLEQNEPDRINRARWLLSCNGWLFAKLCGVFCADISDGSNPFFDMRARTYSQEVLRLYDLGGRAYLLPPIQTGSNLIAPLKDIAAGELGVPAGTPVVMAPYDIVTTAYGCGNISAGDVCIILGTTLCTEAITASLDLDSLPMGTTIALEQGSYLRAMPTLTGCEALTWASKILSCKTIKEFDCLALGAKAGAQGLLFLPYLSPAGERAPFLRPDARGSFLGLSLAHTRADMARSIYEGLAFVVRECVMAVAANLPQKLSVCGGGSRSDLWCQILSDVVGIPVIRTEDSEVGARGTFLVGITASSSSMNMQDAVHQFVHTERIFYPLVALHEMYSERFHQFLQQRELSFRQWRLQEGWP